MDNDVKPFYAFIWYCQIVTIGLIYTIDLCLSPVPKSGSLLMYEQFLFKLNCKRVKKDLHSFSTIAESTMSIS